MKKGTVVRKVVSRLVMGAETMFSPEMIADEMNEHRLKAWGVLVQEESNVDPVAFRTGLGLDAELHIGCLKKEARSNRHADAQL